MIIRRSCAPAVGASSGATKTGASTSAIVGDWGLSGQSEGLARPGPRRAAWPREHAHPSVPDRRSRQPQAAGCGNIRSDPRDPDTVRRSCARLISIEITSDRLGSARSERQNLDRPPEAVATAYSSTAFACIPAQPPGPRGNSSLQASAPARTASMAAMSRSISSKVL